MSRVDAVAFDLWETLLTNSREMTQIQKALRVAGLARELARHSIVADEATVERAHTEVWNRCHELYWSRDRDIPTTRQVEHMLELMDARAGAGLVEALEMIYADVMLEHPPALVDGAREVLEWCSDRGLRVGLVSNTGRTPGRTLRTLLETMGLAPLFDTMVFSNEVGWCKPRPEIFDHLLAGLGVEPTAALFVGDNPHADVAGAIAAGMRGVHFDPAERGTAFAPSPPGVEPPAPWLRITTLRELPGHIEDLIG